MVMAKNDSGTFQWVCRQCGGKGEATLLRIWLGLENGVPPKDAEDWNQIYRRYEAEMRRERSPRDLKQTLPIAPSTSKESAESPIPGEDDDSIESIKSDPEMVTQAREHYAKFPPPRWGYHTLQKLLKAQLSGSHMTPEEKDFVENIKLWSFAHEYLNEADRVHEE